jgi:hypothetical protein
MRFDSSLPLSLSILLTDEVLEKAAIGKSTAMRMHGLELERTLSTPMYTCTLKGTYTEESGIKSAYEMRWRHFHGLCVLVGFYTCSLLLDCDACPDRPIPVEIDKICLYIAYMTSSTGDELLHPDTKRLIFDVMSPELCPIHALLLYISLSGITVGFIFPKFLPCKSTNEDMQDDSSTESTGDVDESTLHYP